MYDVVQDLKARAATKRRNMWINDAECMERAAAEIERLRARNVGRFVGGKPEASEPQDMPSGWRLISVYPFKTKWEYCIERHDFARCCGEGKTRDDALAEAAEAAVRFDARQPAQNVGQNVG